MGSGDQSNSKQGKSINTEDMQTTANLTIHSIFVKDISYESPSSPQAFSLPWEPQVKFDIQVMRRLLEQEESLHEVVLHATVVAKLKIASNDTKNNVQQQELVAFIADVKLGGLFTVKGLNSENLDQVLSTTAPTILFPYLAETISSLVIRGGFPQFILPPIDFVALYQQRLHQSSNLGQTNTDGSVTVN